MRINSFASGQYRRTDALTERTAAVGRTAPQASVTTTSFGFRLGNFGLDYESERTVLDPSLSRTAREQNQQARAFAAERQVGSLRAQVGAEGATYRDLSGNNSGAASAAAPLHRIKSALSAYAKSAEEALPLPGSMLAGVV
ncbi:hypothetical protein [Pseudodesulfovibrio sp.]|uniref:hypothetical protein n=1 Tax=Pseudodesulfovibrio sp. TaxID=2035812 RepID=UPI0026230BE1|nr:hypothetical protein [Pseudodesulfovibrio sp.]MDD3311915.1 hypothetical protein [Pseudodesulfovibrio sp.]